MWEETRNSFSVIKNSDGSKRTESNAFIRGEIDS